MKYRNTRTGQVNTYAIRIPRLERSELWEPVTDDVVPAPSPARPADSSPKDAWVAYAESLGIDVKGLTKKKIIEAVG